MEMSENQPKPTPLLDQLESGPWPSFVTEIKRAAEKSPAAGDLLGLLERSYEDKKGHWKHGGIVGVRGYGSGVIGRYNDIPEEFPNVAHFHTLRVNQPSGWFYTSDALRTLADSAAASAAKRTSPASWNRRATAVRAVESSSRSATE